MTRQLVRDPYTKLGGVASGLAHYYGLDVSMVRIAFVVFTFASGFGLPIYLLSWMIIPRAEHWPPVGAAKPIRSLSGREIGVGLLLLGALTALFFSGGAVSQVLVPLVLVAGGVWLLGQPAAEDAAANDPAAGRQSHPVPPMTDSASGGSQPAGSQPAGSQLAGSQPAGSQPAGSQLAGSQLAGSQLAGSRPPDSPSAGSLPAGSPVPPRRRRWRPILLVLLLIVAVPVAAVTAAVVSGVDFGSDFSATYRPQDVESIPASISHDQGEVLVDLTELDPAMFSGDPVPLAIELGFGQITVIVPDDLVVDVDANTTFGDVNVFGSSDEGIGPGLRVPEPGADVALDIKVGLGQVDVQRG